MTKLKKILSVKLNLEHFISVLILTIGTTIGLFILSIIIIGWLYFSEPSASPRMYSNLTLFNLLTIDLIILLLGLFTLYKCTEKKQTINFQKSYLLIIFLTITTYIISTPFLINSNP